MTEHLERVIALSFSPRGLRFAVPLAIAGIVATAAAFAVVEERSLWDGLWWAFVTVTTVGYGDVIPESPAGRILGIALMLGGIGFLLLLAGALVEHFVSVEVEEHEVLRRLDLLTRSIEELTARIDAQHHGDAALDTPGRREST